MAQLLVVRDRLNQSLGRDAVKQHLVLTTDPEHGVLRRMAHNEGLVAFDLPAGVGGRFSVFTAVGLLPAALAGIDIRALMQGVEWASQRTQSQSAQNNEALATAALLHHLDTACGRQILFTVAYADALAPTMEWFQQLWAESLGKSGAGQTPVPAVGATCQHSQLQLWMDGPHNAVMAFAELGEFDCDVNIPKLDSSDYPELDWIAGHSLGDVLSVERKATQQALTDAGRPNFLWNLPRLSAQNLAAFMVQLEAMTAYAGGLYGVDPFDQPGVEAGKVIAKEMLSRG